MKNLTGGGLLALVLCLLPGPVRGELALDELRDKFESALETEKLEFGTKKLKLRDGYTGALERLKKTLGREGKLEEAAQVLAEIEQARKADPDWDLPANADHRFKSLRTTWVSAHEKLVEENRGNVAKLSTIYFRVIEDRKNSLTRAGKIKEAMAADEEIKRVQELPEVKAAQPAGAGSPRGDDPDDLEAFLPGKIYSYVPQELRPRKIQFLKGGKFIFTDSPDLVAKWQVKGGTRTVVVSHRKFKSPLEFRFSRDGKSYEGKQVSTGNGRKGLLLEWDQDKSPN